ncbi:MAG: Hsp20/alpha crystallin family protein [Halioglobus sp.]|nr:Hsp20/alpha crystallin family protein [Halioglobus sp.]MCB1707334.1 Hsp20/alpha crystallin family protein [Halioglobus sp.]MCP5121614.1 Hsp20/alpha crystallin family protein [Pseudomonadales bacterium]MCP5194953.1 Hsp20/alpha crystallin family protein [Pseudomonadales bacterium]
MFRDISILDTLLDQLWDAQGYWREPGNAGSPSSPGIRSVSRGTFPPINVGSSPDSVHVYLFAAGLDPQSLNATLQQNLLTLSGERRLQVEDGAARYRRELFEGPFQRVITLPEDVDPDAVDARYLNGVLHIRVGRREEVRPRKITIH